MPIVKISLTMPAIESVSLLAADTVHTAHSIMPARELSFLWSNALAASGVGIARAFTRNRFVFAFGPAGRILVLFVQQKEHAATPEMQQHNCMAALTRRRKSRREIRQT